MDKFRRKLKKLFKTPGLFFKDMKFKHKMKLDKYLNIKHSGQYHFTIVTAVYNVEKYLDEFFNSIVNQSLNFKKHIQIICVDDGSTDNSAEIIKRWKRKYPNNIRYFHKENGGQGSARNFGLEYVNTEWVTFIDPDDYLNTDYFRNIDVELSKDDQIQMVICNMIFFMEDEKIYKDTHPLKYRFKDDVNKVDMLDLKDNINLSVASSLFKTKIIKECDVRFNHKVKPNFEDGKFIADYMLHQTNGCAAFLKGSHYLYRKRSDGSSTLDNVWKQKEKFYDVLKYGYVSMLKEYQKKVGYIPVHIQRTVIYDIVWYISYLLNQDGKADFLSEKQKNEFHDLLLEIFTYIDVKTISGFNLAGAWWLHKIIMLAGFKKEPLTQYFAYVESINREKEQICLSYLVETEIPLEKLTLNNKDYLPDLEKTLPKTLVGKTVLFERFLWISYKNIGKNKVNLSVNGKRVQINMKGKWFREGISSDDVYSLFKPSEKYQNIKDAWIVMDRDMQADDNGEHFYRFVSENYPEQEIYYALSPKSHDWERLRNEGFNLLEYGSDRFEKTLRSASKIISSHAEAYVENYFNDNYEFTKKFVFLQHGITQHNLSNWLNNKKILRCFITATYPEHHSIANKNSPYKFNERDVVLTGFPRHDALLKGNEEGHKTILIMPTWRNYIVGKIKGKGFSRSLNEYFTDTLYYKHWQSFLSSPQLEMLAKQYGYKVIFAPHANVEPYLPQFVFPEYIDIWKAKDGKIQRLFQTSTFMVTDYSSVAFEMAYLGKTVLYYQFDKALVFSGGHTTLTGYFDYERDAFGAVAYNESDLLAELEKILKANGRAIEPYATRIKETFPFRDGNNCERVYQAIKALDNPESDLDKSVLINALSSAYQYKEWELVKTRANRVIDVGDEEEKSFAQAMKLEALYELKEFEALNEMLAMVKEPDLRKKYQLGVSLALSDWGQAVPLLENIDEPNVEELILLIHCYVQEGKTAQARRLQNKVKNKPLDNLQAVMVAIWDGFLKQDWPAVVKHADSISVFSTEELKKYQPELLLAKAYRKQELFNEAHEQLIALEKHSRGTLYSRLEIAHLAFARKKYTKVINQIEQILDNDLAKLPEQSLYEYAVSLDKEKKQAKFSYILQYALMHYPDNEQFKLLDFSSATTYKKWQVVIDRMKHLSKQQRDKALYSIVLAHYRLGLFDELKRLAIKPTANHDYEYWELISEIALIQENLELAKYCYKGMLSMFPDRNNKQNKEMLISLLK